MRIYRKVLGFFICLMFVSVIWGSSIFPHAEEDTGEPAPTETEAPQYNISNGIVQVVLVYQDSEGSYHIIQSGSGIVVDSSTVITSNQTLKMTEERKVEVGNYLSEQLGETITFVKAEGVNDVATYQIAIVEEADIYNFSTVLFSSEDWDVAVLSLATPVSKEKAVLGDSDSVEVDDAVSALGFPTTDYTSPRSFQLGDVVITNGTCVNRTGGDIGFDAGLEPGNTGGALTDQYGRVVGITSYGQREDGHNYALPINQVKGYLVKYEVAYMEDVNVYDAPEEETEQDPEGNSYQTDKEELYRTIKEAQLIFEDGNDGVYTAESFRELELNLDYANKTYEDSEAEQRQIDEDNQNLQEAIDNLKKVEKKNTLVIVLIIVISVLVVAILVILIIFLVSRGKKKKAATLERQRLKSLEQMNASRETAASTNSGKIRQDSYPSSQLYAQFDAKANASRMSADKVMPAMELGTKVLQTDMGTSILNADIQQQTSFGYLYHMADGESVAIYEGEFVVGKGFEDVSYRIDGNPNISRRHAMITRSYNDYYIEDLNSTNGTYVNGVKLVPGKKQILQMNDIILLGNEQLVFMISA